MVDNLTDYAHKDSIKRLVEEFGLDREKSIREIYRNHREQLEAEAKILSYIPTLAYNATRQTLQAQHPAKS